MTTSLPPFQRHSDTSLAAALAELPARAKHADKVLAVIRACGPITDEAIAEALGMNPSTERPRRIELQRAGKIQEAEARQLTRSGRAAVAWIVPAIGEPLTIPGL